MNVHEEMRYRYGVVEIHLSGRCADTKRLIGGRNLAHAHVGGRMDKHICYSLQAISEGLWNEAYPTPTLLHEVAHTMLPLKARHGPVWRRRYRALMEEWDYAPQDVYGITSVSYAKIAEQVAATERASGRQRRSATQPEQGRLF